MHRIFRSFVIGMFFIIPVLSTTPLLAAVESSTWASIKSQVTDHAPQPAGKTITSNRVAGEWEELIYRGETFYPDFYKEGVLLNSLNTYLRFGDTQLHIQAYLKVPEGRYRNFLFKFRSVVGKMDIGTSDVVRYVDGIHLNVVSDMAYTESDMQDALLDAGNHNRDPEVSVYVEIWGIR